MKARDFKNKKVVIMGLGLHGGGVGAARFMAKNGAKVLVTDLKREEELKESIRKLKEFKNIEYVLGQHRIEDFKTADIIIKNPGVSNASKHLKVAEEHRVKIDTDVGIFFELCPAQIIGITGSKGKSTTAALISEALKTEFQSVFLAGNNRLSVLDILSGVKKHSIVVLELSSYQLDGLAPRKKSPHLAVITNIFREHLDRYDSFRDYQKSKELIFKFQDQADYLIINKRLKKLPGIFKAKAKIIFYSGRNEDAAREVGKIYGLHHRAVEKAIKSFPGLPGRMELVAEINGIKFINDTCATHPKAVIRALNLLVAGKIILIAGGLDKKLEFKEMNEVIKARVKALILFPGDASEKINQGTKAILVNNMAEAVAAAQKIAINNDTVILSPGAASFNLFKHEFDRGEQFVRLVKQIASQKTLKID